MNRAAAPKGTGLACLALCWLLAAQPAAAATAGQCAEAVARAVSIQGTVEARGQAGGTWHRLVPEDTLCAGDQVRTRAHSRAALYLNNDTILRLGQHSTVSFTGLARGQASWLDLKAGMAHFISRLKQHFEVITPYVNAGVDGTEFVVEVAGEQAEITVLEGRVRAKNEHGEVQLGDGAAALARAGEAPVRRLQVQPWNAVTWALHYPTVIDYRALAAAPPTRRAVLMPSLQAYGRGDSAAALAVLEEELAEDTADATVYVFRAGLRLSVGQVAQARRDLEAALRLDPGNGHALALQAVMAVVTNQTAAALRLAQQGVAASPDSVAPWLALSYAQQANFDLAKARASLLRAVELQPQSALAWARLAELQLMFEALDEALVAARRAAQIDPDLARTQSVLGFASLIRLELDSAEQAFHRAMRIDQADPLPRLGLGLAMIRRGELASGRRQIEYAASLAPTHSLIRSYLGKAYYEEKRNPLAATQFALAKDLDPQDPTPWFYDAIRKHSDNRPVRALQDLQHSRRLNDNRAVYRSRLLLDEDAAARGASLARIYSDLGLHQLALLQGWRSLDEDPTNAAAHRFLADTYASLPRHEIGRLAELLQAQLWQPLQLNSLQPQLAESDLGIAAGAGPSGSAFNEFTPLFMRERIRLQINGVVAGNETRGNDLLLSGIEGPWSFSLGQFHYESDGYRENNDQQQDIYNLFVQLRLSPRTSIQAELRTLERERGDLGLRVDADDFSPDLRERREVDTWRLGFRHAFSPAVQTIGSLIMQDFEETVEDLPLPVLAIDSRRTDTPYLAELQQVFLGDRQQVVFGLGHFESDRETRISQVLDLGFPIPPSTTTATTTEQVEFTNAYLYSDIAIPDNLTLSLGASVDDFEGSTNERDQLNPKFGLTWAATPTVTLRMAAFRTLKRELVTDQTIEPTQIAGFNQFFDDPSGTDAKRYGAALDLRPADDTFAGLELSDRDLDVPYQDSEGDMQESDWNEEVQRGYLYWHANQGLALRIEFQREVIDAELANQRDDVLFLKTHRLPLGLSYYLPSGLSFATDATYIKQEGRFYDTTTFITSAGRDRFWVVDASLSYRLPQRRGMISVGAKNLLDNSFSYHELDPEHPEVYPERLVFARFTVVF